MQITIKQLDELRIHAGAARGAVSMLACSLGSDRGIGEDLNRDALRNLNSLLTIVRAVELANNTENDQNAVNY